MNALLETKPNYAECYATNEGWVDAKTGELLVAFKNLKRKLDNGTKRKPGRPKKIKPTS